ncbi:MAG: zinc ribbon domain-containing protein [Ruminococcus sp.]|nr:zinc ribbon domain-containing protein [Ruminococcus sp.]
MKCIYCGRENPDGATFCECGRPLRLGNSPQPEQNYQPAGNSPFAYQTLDSVKRKKSVPKLPIIILLMALIGVGVFFGIRWMNARGITDEDSWETINKPTYSITIPTSLDEGKMLELPSSVYKSLDFYTGREAGVYISAYSMTDYEKSLVEGKTPAELIAMNKRTITINGQKLVPKVRNNYFYMEYSATRKNYVGKSDDIWVISAELYSGGAAYCVEAYCAQEDKEKYHESMLKWIDSFKPN